MAVVTDTFVATVSRTVFTKLPDSVRLYTSHPRAILNFSVINGTISAKPLNDQQELHIGMTLDPSFAYRLVDFNCHLTQDVANDWTSRAYLEITNGVRGLGAGSTRRHSVILEDGIRIPTALEQWIGVLGNDRGPRYVIQATPQGPLTMNFRATNLVAAAGAAGATNAMFSFLEYDIEQAQFFVLHWPELALLR